MPLFDSIERSYFGSARYAEPRFSYLNRSARAESTRVRYVLEEWFQRYPVDSQAEFSARFRSDLDWQNQAAFFELFLHELLLRLGCRVTLHPLIPNSTRSPDFLLQTPTGEKCYVEATVVTNESAEKAASRARVNAVYDSLDRLVNSPNFFLWLEVEGVPATPPPARKLASLINDFLAGLDPGEVAKQYNLGGADAVPKCQFEHDGWKVEIRPIPKSNEARGRPDIRPLGMLGSAVQWVDHRTPIRDVIIDKANRYGALDVPYVVAVNALDLVDEIDIMEALLGKEQYTIVFSETTPTGSHDTRFSRAPDGVWTGPRGPRNRGVSGVLVVTRLSPWNISRATMRLYHNPWAKMPCRSVLSRLPQAIPNGGRVNQTEGESANSILGLPETWPEGTG